MTLKNRTANSSTIPELNFIYLMTFNALDESSLPFASFNYLVDNKVRPTLSEL